MLLDFTDWKLTTWYGKPGFTRIVLKQIGSFYYVYTQGCYKIALPWTIQEHIFLDRTKAEKAFESLVHGQSVLNAQGTR